MIATNGETHRRGPYRKSVKIPRQTLYNRRRKFSADRPRRCPPHSEPESTRTQPESLSPQDTSLDLNNGEDYDVDMISEQTEEPTANDSPSQLTCPQSADNSSVVISNETTAEHVLPMLYEGSALSTENSLLLISSYMCRHHLTGQAREDLLELMRLHLPQDNNLPSSLYLAQKASGRSSIVPNYHHYCQHCYTILQDCATSLCPNEYCKTTIDLLTSPYFITVSIADQLNILLSHKFSSHVDVIAMHA